MPLAHPVPRGLVSVARPQSLHLQGVSYPPPRPPFPPLPYRKPSIRYGAKTGPQEAGVWVWRPESPKFIQDCPQGPLHPTDQ